MEKSDHVFLIAPGAEEFARAQGVDGLLLPQVGDRDLVERGLIRERFLV